MAISCKYERSLLNHDEHEAVRVTHHPAIHDVSRDELHQMRHRLRDLRDKERTLARQTRRETRGKAEARGGSFPGLAERPLQRKQVFAAALKRVNNELGRIHKLEKRAALTESAHRALAMRRESMRVHHPATGDAADQGMPSNPSKRRNNKLPPSQVGRASQATKVSQAARDSRS